MKKDIRYVPSPPRVVAAMLDLAALTSADVFYDLGCGDGRLVIAAAQRGARAIGIDIDPGLIERCTAHAREAGLLEKTEFRVENFFQVDLREATVVALYLLHRVNRALLPKLLREMRPGTRLVSHSFDMGDWEPQEVITVDSKLLHLWTLPF